MQTKPSLTVGLLPRFLQTGCLRCQLRLESCHDGSAEPIFKSR